MEKLITITVEICDKLVHSTSKITTNRHAIVAYNKDDIFKFITALEALIDNANLHKGTMNEDRNK